MSSWTLHWLEAEGGLGPWRGRVAAEIEATRGIVAGLVAPPRLDIVVQRLPGWVIPEIGLVGHSYRRSLFSLTLDPDNPNFAASLENGTLRQQVVHEVHHCLRTAARGHGRSLGDALIGEGLAGHFVHRLFANPPEPWECAVEPAVVAGFFPEQRDLSATDYNHGAWFYGAGTLPRWIGYTLGYTIVGDWLKTVPEADGAALVEVPTADVLSAWSGRDMTLRTDEVCRM
ncbi:MAG: hypothetical protein JO258_18640 [Alphaproteobacteria bacterium]|nr:hypothetical protein [Alphaproteobacteria bacterium]